MKTNKLTRSKTALFPAILMASAMFLTPRAEATNYTWAGGTAAWDTAASWTPNIAGGPVTGDSIINAATGATRMNINSTITPSVSLVDIDFSVMGGAANIFNNASTGNNSTLSFASAGTLTKGTNNNLTIRGHTGGPMSMSLNTIQMTDGQLYLGGDSASNANYGLTAFNVSGTANLSSSSLNSAVAIGTAAGVTANLQQVNLGGNIVLRLSTTGGANRVRNVTMTGLNGTSGTAVHGNNVNNTGTSYTTLTINSTPSTTSTFNGTISNGTGTGHFLNLVKGDTGTQVLGGNNTYTGTTTVNAGTLLINTTVTAGNSGTGSGSVSVTSGTLGGVGILRPGSTNTITVSNGGFLAPGDSTTGNGIGTLVLDSGGTTGALLTLDTGAKLSFQLGSGLTSDKIDFWNYAGATDLVRNSNVIDITMLAGSSTGTYRLFNFYSDSGSTVMASGISGGFGVNFLNGATGALVYNTNSIDLQINTVPEPATWALIAFSLTSVLVFRRRRFQG